MKKIHRFSFIKFFKKFFQPKVNDKKQLSELVSYLSKKKIIKEYTGSIIESVLHLSTLKARDIMIPRSQMIVIPQHIEFKDLCSLVASHGHSRYPVIGDSKDEIIGILHTKDLILQKIEEQPFTLSEILRPHLIIPESKQLLILLKDFRSNRNHMAIVVDEYGSVSGFITIEDVLEQIVGDIEDEFDNDEDNFIKARNDGTFIIKAHIPIEEFNQYFHTDYDINKYDTLNTMLKKKAITMPVVGEVVIIDKAQYKILNADSNHIKLVEITLRGIK